MNSPLTDRAAFLTRRQFFAKGALGIGGAALASLLYLERGYQRSYRLVPALLLVGASFMLAVPALN